MDLVITYDVDTTTREGRRRLRRIATACKSYGQRVQFSVFECRLSTGLFEEFEARLLKIIDPSADSLRIYFLHGDYSGATRVHGIDRRIDFDDPLIL